MLTGETVVCLSTIDWDFNWQGHQEIMAALAASGNRVLFVETTGVRAPGIRDLPRLRQRLANWRRGHHGFREVRPRLFVYSPLALPLPYSRPARGVNRLLLGRALRRWVRAMGDRRPLLWTFLPTPLTLDLIETLDPQLTVYYCVDDLPGSSPAARRLAPSEARLLRAADVVLVTTEALAARARRFRACVHIFPFGVRYADFARVRDGARPAPADVRDLPRPLVGYVGGLNDKLDQALVAGVAAALPEATFVLVGPLETRVSALRACANVRLLGPRPHEVVPDYLKAFDVGLVPYRLTGYTGHVYPAKVNEYLAMGLPVVSTDLREMRRLNAQHGPIVEIAAGVQEFSAAIRSALHGASGSSAARRIEVARGNDWTERIEAMAGIVAGTLRGRPEDRPSEATREQALPPAQRAAHSR
jgi:glycosyltransferase involved in cell wall biosynthesis